MKPMEQERRHLWIVSDYRKDREKQYHEIPSLSLYISNCNKAHKGPYTGTGNLLRSIIPETYKKWPELIKKHSVEILSIAPELKSIIPADKETLTSLAVPIERTRFYSSLRTLRMAHGIIDLLLKLSSQNRMGKMILVFENVHLCESLDAEFLSHLLRRVTPDQMEIIISSNVEIKYDNLKEAINLYTIKQEIIFTETKGNHMNNTTKDIQLQLAKNYVDSDGTSESFAEKFSYENIPDDIRKNMHKERVEFLLALNQYSYELGAIPYHREQVGSKKETIESLIAAVWYCLDIGFYEAVVDLTTRGIHLVNWKENEEEMFVFVTKKAMALGMLGEVEQTPKLYQEVLNNTDSPRAHSMMYYSFAMYYTRYKEVKDHNKALEWIKKAISLSDKLEDEKDRAFNKVFNQNGLALIEMHMGNLTESLRLVMQGWDLLNQVLEPHENLLHRSVLLYNQGQVLSSSNRLEEALHKYNQVIEIDPNYPEYHFDRGNIYSNMGLLEKAIENYDKAIELGPPFPEVYYNRANAYNRLGHTQQAIQDYNYLLELEPEHINGIMNRATLFYEQGAYSEARKDVEKGLTIESNHAQLLCTLGLIEMEEGDFQKALEAFNISIAQQQNLLEAWTNRAIVHFEMNHYDLALNDLSKALTIEENSTVLYNRAWIYEKLEDWKSAIADYTHSLKYDDVDQQEVYYRRGLCFIKNGEIDSGAKDWKNHLSLGDSEQAEEIKSLMSALITS